jgi:conjugative relaxase-like TrwC/TraI family protein
MLSIAALSPGRADYYVQQVAEGLDEYYTGDQAEPGHWAGQAAERLGLSGRVTPEQFRRLLDGRDPTNGEPLGVPLTTAHRVGGFDLCFSAPKSVSLAWALGGPELATKVAGAHDRAVAQAVSALEQEALRARRGAGGKHVIETEGLVGATFVHRSSRLGDPQLHTHLVADNLTPDASGRWSALDSKRLFRWAKPVGYLYQAALRHELAEELGLSFGPAKNGAADLAGMPKEMIKAFSSRRADIEAALEERGLSSRSAAEVAALATRGPKAAVPGLEELRERWAAQAAELGLGPRFVAGLTVQPRQEAPDIPQFLEHLVSPAGLTAKASAFDRRGVLQELAAAHVDGAPVAAVRAQADELIGRGEVVALKVGRSGEQLYSTVELLGVEEELVARARRQAGAGMHPVPEAALRRALAARPTLSDEQRHMVSTLVTSGAGVQIVIGRAGAGKTFGLDAAREAWQASGHRVVGAALAARAAAELQAGSGIPSTTLDRFLADLERPGPLTGLAPRSVVVVDEAGMVETRKLARLLAHAERWGAQVVLTGDPRQLPEVGAGGAFGALAKQLAGIELMENRRQHEVWEREALAELRSGSVVAAVSAYEQAGRVTLAPTAEMARDALVDAWWKARQTGDQVMMYALRRSDVDDLNARARARMDAAGLLGDERLNVSGRQLAPGDQVMCLRNDRRLSVRNGSVGTVTSIEGGGVALADGTHLPAAYVEAGHLTHSYGSTVHKSQGATVDRAFLLGSDQLYREAGYVGLSRARLSSELFVVAPDPSLEMGDRIGQLVRGLSTSRAQELALDQLPAFQEPVARVVPISAARALLADPPAWAVEALGEPPVAGDDRPRWAERAAHLASYRDAYHVTDEADALGPRPANQSQRRAWEVAQLALLDHQRSFDIERGLAI